MTRVPEAFWGEVINNSLRGEFPNQGENAQEHCYEANRSGLLHEQILLPGAGDYGDYGNFGRSPGRKHRPAKRLSSHRLLQP